jgi:hypothetical protein
MDEGTYYIFKILVNYGLKSVKLKIRVKIAQTGSNIS